MAGKRSLMRPGSDRKWHADYTTRCWYGQSSGPAPAAGASGPRGSVSPRCPWARRGTAQ